MAIIAAFFIQNAEGTQDKLIQLIDQKVIQIVDDTTIMHKEDLLIHINNIDPMEKVYCIALPPVYLIHLTGEKYE